MPLKYFWENISCSVTKIKKRKQNNQTVEKESDMNSHELLLRKQKTSSQNKAYEIVRTKRRNVAIKACQMSLLKPPGNVM